MAISIDELFKSVSVKLENKYEWGEKINETFNGVYIISLANDASSKEYAGYKFKIDKNVFKEWNALSTNLEVKNKKQMSIEDFSNYLKTFWQNENILYIGQSTSNSNTIGKRIQQFYDHKVGHKGPHTGGYWVKLLNQDDIKFNVFIAKSENPLETEFKLLFKYIELKSGKSIFELENIGQHLPFANLKVDVTKKHEIKNAVKSIKR